MSIATFEVKLGCDNCGHIDTYQLPTKTVIEPYNYDDDERTYSHYHRFGQDEPTYVNCKYCQLAYLKIFWWDESAVETAQSQ